MLMISHQVWVKILLSHADVFIVLKEELSTSAAVAQPAPKGLYSLSFQSHELCMGLCAADTFHNCAVDFSTLNLKEAPFCILYTYDSFCS